MLTNSKRGYGWLSIALHWVMAVMISFLFGLGLYMVELTYYDAWYKGSLDLHKSIGVTVAAVLVFRLIWRLVNIRPEPVAGKVWELRAAHWMHRLLYLGLFLSVTTGYLISTAKGHPIIVFEWLAVPAMPWQIDNQEDLAGEIHEVLAWSMALLVSIHALAALKHHYIDKDDVLVRMLKTK